MSWFWFSFVDVFEQWKFPKVWESLNKFQWLQVIISIWCWFTLLNKISMVKYLLTTQHVFAFLLLHRHLDKSSLCFMKKILAPSLAWALDLALRILQSNKKLILSINLSKYFMERPCIASGYFAFTGEIS